MHLSVILWLALLVSVNGQRGGVACFYGEEVAWTSSGPQKIKSLKSGDLVLAVLPNGTLVYSPVLMQIHTNNSQQDSAVNILTHEGRNLTLTSTHILFATEKCLSPQFHNAVSKLAGSITTKDCLFVKPNAQQQDHLSVDLVLDKVESVRTVSVVGLYNPILEMGTILVNDIAASCYAYVADHYMAHSVFSVLHYLPKKGMPYIEKMFQDMTAEALGAWLMTLSGNLSYSDEYGMCFRKR